MKRKSRNRLSGTSESIPDSLEATKQCTKGYSLAHLLQPDQEQAKATEQEQQPVTYGRFKERVKHTRTVTTEESKLFDIVESDPVIQHYYEYLTTRPKKPSKVSHQTKQHVRGATYNFLSYTGLPIANDTYTKILAKKQAQPNNIDLEQAIRSFATVESPSGSTKSASRKASTIIAIFTRGNFCPLKVRVNTHQPNDREDCSTHTFLDTYQALNYEEAKDAIQWSVYSSARPAPCYKVPFSAFKIKGNYAIAWIQTESNDYANKTFVKHPMIIPLKFYNKIRERSEKAGRRQPFPNYASLFKWQVTPLAEQLFHEKCVSNRGRKFFEEMADKAHISPAIAAFIMGDDTKLQQTGHLPDYYNPALRESALNGIVAEYRKLEPYLDLSVERDPETFVPLHLPIERTDDKDAIRAEIRRLQSMLGDETV